MTSTRREIIDDVLGFVTELGDTTARDVASRLLNRALLTIYLTRQDWQAFKAATPYSFSTVAGTRGYALPSYVGRLADPNGKIREMSGGTPLYPITQPQLDTDWPTFGTVLETRGSPAGYVLGGTAAVATQPSSTGDALEVVSTSGSDTTVLVYVEGLNAAGASTRAQVTLTGLTPVAIGTWASIERFGKSLPAGQDPEDVAGGTALTTSIGSVSLQKAPAGTVLQTLFPDESAVEHALLTLVPTPDAVYTISVPYTKALARVFQDADPLPRYWGNALFEEMKIQWEINKGNITLDQQIDRPALRALVESEYAQRVPSMSHKQPFR